MPDLEIAFKAFDTDRSGKVCFRSHSSPGFRRSSSYSGTQVSASELRNLMKMYGTVLTAAEVEEIIAFVDSNGDGEVCCAVLCNG